MTIEVKVEVDKKQKDLDQEGVYAFGFVDEATCQRATSIIPNDSGSEFRVWPSCIEDASNVAIIKKPFAKTDYERRLEDLGISFKEIPVYRRADLTKEQINSRGFGIWTRDNYLVDLAGSIRK